MILDTSAVIAVLTDEDDGPQLGDLMATAHTSMSAATLVECGIVWDRRNPSAPEALSALLTLTRTQIAPFTDEHADLARAAYRVYGKGSGHPAQLNFGDCLSYALAKHTGEPLLFTGEDFTHTDIRDARSDPDTAFGPAPA
ncbi:MAG TPA: type II toxin-antitoxin system VapC family toxin [Intrasporangiaceae bacterium]|nr:type II toxin-antitoxin system VapC family toxin [Intrasporangiaceae bacterium]